MRGEHRRRKEGGKKRKEGVLDTCDSSHLTIVIDAHELFHEFERELGVLQAIDGEPLPRLLIALLQRVDDRVVHVLLLLAEELRGHVIQGVAGEFLLPVHVNHHVELYPALEIHLLRVSHPHLLTQVSPLLDLSPAAFDSSQEPVAESERIGIRI